MTDFPQVGGKDALVEARAQIVRELETDPDLTPVKVLGTGVNDSQEQIEKAMQNYAGAFITVSSFAGKCDKPDIQGPRIETKIAVTFVELVELNRSKKGTRVNAEQGIVSIMKRLHLLKLRFAGTHLVLDDFGPIADETLFMLSATFKATINLRSTAPVGG